MLWSRRSTSRKRRNADNSMNTRPKWTRVVKYLDNTRALPRLSVPGLTQMPAPLPGVTTPGRKNMAAV
eukprot:299481-Lingulodinium_polyedra.AAC.1